jgi:hypothetical protein
LAIVAVKRRQHGLTRSMHKQNPARRKGIAAPFIAVFSWKWLPAGKCFENNPRAKLIFIARDPVERIESSFREMHNSAPKFGLNTPFRLEEALLEMPQILGDTSYYSRMKTHRDRFGEEKCAGDLYGRHDGGYRGCRQPAVMTFLGVGEHHFTREMLPHVNQGKEKLYDSRLFSLDAM